MPRITPIQWLGIIILFNSTLIGGASQLGDLSLSPAIVKAILAVATLGNGFLGGLVTMFGSMGSAVNSISTLARTPQGQQAVLEAVESMPGVSAVQVNRKANPTIGALALDPTHGKIQALPGEQGAITATVKAAGAILLAIIIGWSALPTDARAQNSRLPNPIGRAIEAGAGNAAASAATDGVPKNILAALDDKILPDLIAAKAMADATGNDMTSTCYGAWIDIIQKRQGALKDAQGNPIPIPDPHIISDFERAVELRNALQPDSKFSRSCSPLANMVKQDVVKLVSTVVAGGAGLAFMGVPIIP